MKGLEVCLEPYKKRLNAYCLQEVRWKGLECRIMGLEGMKNVCVIEKLRLFLWGRCVSKRTM